MAYGKSSEAAVSNARTEGGGNYWKPPTGDTRIRVMPPWAEDEEEFFFETGTHYRVGPDERHVPCPELSGERDSCFLCRLIIKLNKGDSDERAEANTMRATRRFLLSIVVLDDVEEGVRLWECPQTVFRRMKRYFRDPEYGDFTDLEDGYDLTIERSGDGETTKYDVHPARNNSRFPSDKLLDHRNKTVADLYQSIADEEYELPDLSALITFVDDEEMERIWKGLADSGRTRTESRNGGEEDDDGEERPRRSRRSEDEESEDNKPRRRRSRRSEDEEPEEEEDGGDDNGDDDEGEDDKPRRRRSRRSEDGAEDDEKKSSKTKKSSKKGTSRLRGRVGDLGE